MYYLLKETLNNPYKQGEIEFYSNKYNCPILVKKEEGVSWFFCDDDETLILFDSIKDIYKYKKWREKESKNSARKEYIESSNKYYDKETSAYLISLLKSQQDYHEQEYQKAIQQATETVNRCL